MSNFKIISYVKMKRRTPKLNAGTLKLIALVSMFLDHFAATILAKYMAVHSYPVTFLYINELNKLFEINNIWTTTYVILRLIGRISFPIFCFTLVEGFLHTHNVKKYLSRLLIFALISEIPYDLAFLNTFLEIRNQNIFFDLFLCLLTLILLERFEKNFVGQFFVIVIMSLVSVALHAGYNYLGIVFVSIIYLFHYRNKYISTISGSLLMCRFITAPFAFIFINDYNGQKGPSLKYFFYVFYPTHLLVLYGLSLLVK